MLIHHLNYYKKVKDPKNAEVEKVFRALNKKDYEGADRFGLCERAKKDMRKINRRKAEEIVAKGETNDIR